MSEALRIDVHLIDGSVRTFVQDDPRKLQPTLSRLHPDRVYDEPMFTLGGAGQVASIRRSAILRLEVRGDLPGDWGFGPGIDRITVVDFAEFVGAQQVDVDGLRLRTGDPYSVHAEFQDVAGGRVFLRVEGRVMPEAVRVHRIERLMERPCMHARRPDGASVLMQLENVTALTIRPVLQLPLKAIDAREVRES